LKHKITMLRYPAKNVARWQRYKCKEAFDFHHGDIGQDDRFEMTYENLQPYWTYGLSGSKKKRQTKDCWPGTVGKPDLVLEALYHDFKTGLVKKRIIITEVDGEDKTVQPGSNRAISAKGQVRGRGRGRGRVHRFDLFRSIQ